MRKCSVRIEGCDVGLQMRLVDPEVYEAEMRHIFEATWVFVGLETQIPNPHDFITTY